MVYLLGALFSVLVQDDGGGIVFAFIGGLGGLIGYLYAAICLMVIANKTNTPNGWFAFIPILNIFLMFQIAEKSACLYFILTFVPIVNLFILLDTWMGIAQARGKSSAIGCLMFIPIINIVIPAYLAFVD